MPEDRPVVMIDPIRGSTVMTPIEQTKDGALMFLACGCSAWRLLAHPTGAAVGVQVVQPCQAHATDVGRFRSVKKGELVSPFTRTPATLDPIRAQ
jgi:hypothetical protein